MGKRLAWLTDLHLDHAGAPERELLLQEIVASEADAILIGGDTAQSATLASYLRAIRQRTGLPVFFVLGNHDCYGGSIAETRRVAERLSDMEGLTWLPLRDPVQLTDTTSLIGHDGWGDAGFGNQRTPVVLNDFLLIDELRTPSRDHLLAELRRLGGEAGEHFARVTALAVQQATNILCLTHVPPFRQAAWHEGAESDEDWLPFFACRAAGEALVRAMQGQPSCRMTVLCGHTHSGGVFEATPNVTVWTGAAEYRKPVIQRIIEVP